MMADGSVVHEYVDASKPASSFANCTVDGLRIRVVGLNGEGTSPQALDGVDDGLAPVRRFSVCQSDICAIFCQSFCNGGANAARTSRDKGTFSIQSDHIGPRSLRLVEIIIGLICQALLYMRLDRPVSSDGR